MKVSIEIKAGDKTLWVQSKTISNELIKLLKTQQQADKFISDNFVSKGVKEKKKLVIPKTTKKQRVQINEGVI